MAESAPGEIAFGEWPSKLHVAIVHVWTKYLILDIIFICIIILSMEKLIVYPEVYSGFTPHFPALEKGKLARILNLRRQPRSVRLAYLGRHQKEEVLAAPPILCTPNDAAFYILNGKHRCTVGLLRGWPLIMVVVNTVQDIQHCIARGTRGDLTVEALCEQFSDREQYERICIAENAGSIQHLAVKEQEKIVEAVGGSNGLSTFGTALVENRLEGMVPV